jgi:hypothetical protein
MTTRKYLGSAFGNLDRTWDLSRQFNFNYLGVHAQ